MRPSLLIGAVAVVAAAAPLGAQSRVVLPEGTVILVRTNSPLESASMKTGDTFETVVTDTLRADLYTVIPAGSRIRGVVTFVRPANRQQSGVIEVNFDRLTLPEGRTYAMNGKLTSTDTAERRQIDADANARVVLVGGRGGIGAAIAAAGSSRRPETNLLSALGNLLSEGRDVAVPAGTALAVQLERPLALSRSGYASASGANTIYTAAERIRAAQQALARQNYYRGPINGQLNDATQRAIVEYQIDNRIAATGNLDVATAQSLGIYSSSVGGEVASAMMLSPDEAASLRRTAQSLVSQERVDLRIATSGRLDSRRPYPAADLEVWFALSAFADNASLYESLVRGAVNNDGAANAGQALIAAARRVDSALGAGSASSSVRGNWTALRARLTALDPSSR